MNTPNRPNSEYSEYVAAPPGYFMLVWPDYFSGEQALTKIIRHPIIAWRVRCNAAGEPLICKPEPVTLTFGSPACEILYAIEAPDGRVFDPNREPDEDEYDVSGPGWFSDVTAWLHDPEGFTRTHKEMLQGRTRASTWNVDPEGERPLA